MVKCEMSGNDDNVELERSWSQRMKWITIRRLELMKSLIKSRAHEISNQSMHTLQSPQLLSHWRSYHRLVVKSLTMA